MPPEVEGLVHRLVTKAEIVLTWTFINVNLPKKLISVFEADQNPSLRPSDYISDTSGFHRMRSLYMVVRKDKDRDDVSMKAVALIRRGGFSRKFIYLNTQNQIQSNQFIRNS